MRKSQKTPCPVLLGNNDYYPVVDMSKLFIHKLSNVWFSIEHHNFKPKLFRWKNPMPIEFGGIFQPWPEAATEIVAKKEAPGILAARDERGRRGPAGPWRVSHGEAEMVLSGWILWFMVDITSYLMGIIMVYKPTFTSLGGPILYPLINGWLSPEKTWKNLIWVE